jgi:putative ABC transport system permease protein
MAIFSPKDWNLTTVTESQYVSGETVSSNYFSLLGVKPILGRSFNPSEDQPSNSEHAVILGYGIWQRVFGSDPLIVGKSIKLGGRPFSVIGVMPAEFRGISDDAEIWTSTASLDPDIVTNRGNRSFPVLARLKMGVSARQVRTEMQTLAQRLEQAYPSTNHQRGVEMIGLKDYFVRDLRTSVLLSFGAVLLVLLIACANVSNLMLLRAESREREIAVRYALGATRMDTIRLALVENLMLALGGLMLGIWVAYWVAPSVILLSPIPLPSYAHVGLNLSVILFSTVIAGLSALFVSFFPILRFWNRDLNSILSTRTSGGGRSQNLRSALVIFEITLAMVLLIGAGLLVRTFQRLLSLDPGFQMSNIMMLHLKLPTLPGSDQMAFVNRTSDLLQRIQAVPGIENASLSSDVPLDGRSAAFTYTPDVKINEAAQKRPRAFLHRVSTDFFTALGIKLKNGRYFTQADVASPVRVIIVSEEIAQRYWPSGNLIGKRIQIGRADTGLWYLVIGVVDNVRYRGLPNNPTPDPDLYLPLNEPTEELALTIHSKQDPTPLVQPLTTAIKNFESTSVIYDVSTMAERIGEQLVAQRFAGLIMGIFAGIAFLLAIVGIYSVMSHFVFQRTNEIGIRIALGAQPSHIFGSIVGKGLMLGGSGIIVGILFALAMRKLIANLLFGVSALSPLVFGSAAAVMLACVALACYLPARNATKVDPVVALREG